MFPKGRTKGQARCLHLPASQFAESSLADGIGPRRVGALRGGARHLAGSPTAGGRPYRRLARVPLQRLLWPGVPGP